MFDFSGDEGFFLFVAVAITIIGGGSFYRSLATVKSIGNTLAPRLTLTLIPPFCLMIVFIFIIRWSDPLVRDHPDYILLFLTGAGAWLVFAKILMPFLGLSIARDALERNNSAAVISASGAWLAVSIIYAASNVGGGPTIWTTLLPAALASIVLAFLWFIIQTFSGTLADDITIDRDPASALRHAGALIGCAIILGRAAGGNWFSWDQTWSDMLNFSWPSLPLAIAAGCIHRFLRPTPQQPRPSVRTYGIACSFAFILYGVVIVAFTKHGLNPSQW